MSILAAKQRQLVREFDAEAAYWAAGLSRVMWVSGLGASLGDLRRPRERQRPVAVSLTPHTSGRLMLGMTVSRPKNGRLVFDNILGEWDLSARIRPGGALNEAKPRHHRAAVWGLQLLRGLLHDARQIKNGDTAAVQNTAALPRQWVSFPAGRERLDPGAPQAFPDAEIDRQSVPGTTLVDARLVSPATLTAAVNNDTLLEDYRPLLGQRVANPFRFLDDRGVRYRGEYISLSDLQEASRAEALPAARHFLDRGTAKGATDSDILNALRNLQSDMTLSLFSRHQLVAAEALAELPEPYAGSLLPAPGWRRGKKLVRA